MDPFAQYLKHLIQQQVLTDERKKELKIFEHHAGIRFRSKELLNLSLSHRSYSNELIAGTANNERLEFLGDSILGLVVNEYLFLSLPDRPEGDLAKIKSFVVSEDSLAEIARTLRIDNFILIGKGEENSGGRSKKTLLADAFEAILGAYYLDSGFKDAKKFVLFCLVPQIDKVLQNKHRNKDYKTLLQEFAQKRFRSFPRYVLRQKTGPDHDKTFWIDVSVQNKSYGPGKGKNKKEAEQDAARIALETLQPEN